MSSVSNVVQPGLVSTNPFLSGIAPSIGGSTTRLIAPSTSTGGAFGIKGGSGTTTPIPSSINFGGLVSIPGAKSSTSTASAPSIASPNNAGQQYIAPTLNTNTQSTGLGTGGGLAPAGMMYNGQGQLVPISSISATQGTGGASVADVNASANPNTATGNTFNNTVGTLAQTASQPSAQFTQAENAYQQTAAQLAANKAEEAQQNANILGGRTNLQEAGGEQGILAGLAAGQQAALTGQMTAEQATAQNATTQQGTQQTGLAGAAGLVSPTPASALGNFNPATGLVTPYNSGSATNPSTGGVAQAGAVEAQETQGAAVQNATGILYQAQGLAENLTTAINSSGYNPASGVGPAETYANRINQWLQTNSGNPQYQNVANLISEVSAKYAAILQQAGGTPTTQSQVQQQIINGLAGGQQIENILEQLSTNAQTSISKLSSSSQNNAIGNGTSNNTTSGGTTFGSFF